MREFDIFMLNKLNNTVSSTAYDHQPIITVYKTSVIYCNNPLMVMVITH